MSAVTSPVKSSSTQDTERPREGVRWRVELAWATGTAVVSLAMVLVLIDAWKMSLHIPIVLGGDGTFTLSLIKTLVTHPWIGTNADIGAPYGSALYDFSAAYGDLTGLLAIKVMSVGMEDPAALVNVFYLLTFPFIAVTTYGALRILGVARPIAAACALVFTFLPLHFVRSIGHLMLAAYYAVPVAGVIVMGLLGHVELVRRREGDARRFLGWLSGRTLLTVAACVFIGASGTYYALFTLGIAVPMGLLAAFARPARRQIATTAVVGATILATIIAVQAPSIVYWQQNGRNEAISQRSPWESEFYGLRVAPMLLPLPNHRVSAYGQLARDYYGISQLGSEGPSAPLGILMSFGLILAVAVAAASALGRPIRSSRWRLARDAGAAGLFTILLGTVGGGSALIAYLVSPQIRAWNRISVFVAFFALIGLAAALSALRERWPAGRVPAALGAAGLVFVSLFSLWDQSPDGIPQYELNRVAWQSDARFGAAVEAALPDDAMVLQLPYVPFPEHPPVNKMEDYDEFKGYLHTDDVRWSYGAIKGRYPDDWGAFTEDVPMDELVPAAATAGFAAVYVDRFGYTDNGASVERAIRRLTGAGPIVTSADGRLVLYDLAPVVAEAQRDATPAERELAGAALTKPVQILWGAGFFGEESDERRTWRWAGASATMTLVNESALPRTLDVSLKVLTPGPDDKRFVLTLPDGTRKVFRTDGNDEPPTPISTTLSVPPGTSHITVSTNAPDEVSDARDIRMQLIDPVLRESGYEDIATAVDGRPG